MELSTYSSGSADDHCRYNGKYFHFSNVIFLEYVSPHRT